MFIVATFNSLLNNTFTDFMFIFSISSGISILIVGFWYKSSVISSVFSIALNSTFSFVTTVDKSVLLIVTCALLVVSSKFVIAVFVCASWFALVPISVASIFLICFCVSWPYVFVAVSALLFVIVIVPSSTGFVVSIFILL